MEAEYTKRGRIEHHFYAMNSVSIVFIEVKKAYTMGRARLDVIAQILAESAGMSFCSLLLPFVAALANNTSLRLCKLEASTLGAYSCYSLRWREVRIPGL